MDRWSRHSFPAAEVTIEAARGFEYSKASSPKLGFDPPPSSTEYEKTTLPSITTS